MTPTNQSTPQPPVPPASRGHGMVGRSAIIGAALVIAGAGAWATRDPAVQAAPPAAQSQTRVAPIAAPPALAGQAGSYADLVERVAPTVVTVKSERMVQQTSAQDEDDLLRRFFGERAPRVRPRRQGGLGSGVVVTTDGYILTNNHVVDSAEKVTVDLTDGRSFEARVVGTDQASDLAVLKIGATGLSTITVGDSDKSRIGDVVLAVGNPLGLGQTVTMGIISAKGRSTPGRSQTDYEDFIQTDAPINFGNSGGALINARGELIGINSQILSPTGGNIGIGFAIPSNMAQDVMHQLVKGGKVHRGMLGVTVQPVTPDMVKSLGLTSNRGAIVNEVRADTPAERAGIKTGDVILSIDGKPIDSSNSLRNQVARLAPGTSITVSLLRDGSKRDVKLALGEMPTDVTEKESADSPAHTRGKYGLTVEPVTPEIAREMQLKSRTGVVVSEVDPDGVAAEAGIQEGDVIERVNQQAVTSAEDLRSALAAATKDKPALVLINRNGQKAYITLTGRNG